MVQRVRARQSAGSSPTRTGSTKDNSRHGGSVADRDGGHIMCASGLVRCLTCVLYFASLVMPVSGRALVVCKKKGGGSRPHAALVLREACKQHETSVALDVT